MQRRLRPRSDNISGDSGVVNSAIPRSSFHVNAVSSTCSRRERRGRKDSEYVFFFLLFSGRRRRVFVISPASSTLHPLMSFPPVSFVKSLSRCALDSAPCRARAKCDFPYAPGAGENKKQHRYCRRCRCSATTAKYGREMLPHILLTLSAFYPSYFLFGFYIKDPSQFVVFIYFFFFIP